MGRLKRTFASRIGFSIIINSISLFVALVLFRPYWEEIDDIWIATYTEGAFGYNEPHMLFPNIIYGEILCLFQKIIPNIRWHSVFQLLASFIISTAFVYVLSKDRLGRFLSLVFLLASFYEVYVALQYSKVSTFIGIIAYMILFDLCSDTEMTRITRRILCITAWISLLFAMILRPQPFLLATMIAGVYGIVRVIREMTRKEFTKNLKMYCVLFVPVLLAFIVCTVIDRNSYKDTEWVAFTEIRSLTSDMIDYYHDALIYNEHGEELNAIGISENDAYTFITWQYGDDEFLNPDLLRKIESIDKRGLETVNVENLKAWIENINNTILIVNPLVLGLLMIATVYFAFSMKGTNRAFNMAVVITQFLLTTWVLLYYQCSGRWNHRVVYGLLLAQFVLFIYLLNNEKSLSFEPIQTYIIAAILLFAIISIRLNNEFDYRDYGRSVFDHSAITEYMQHNKDKLFVSDTFTFQGFGKYNVFTPTRKGQFDNLVLVGGSYTNSPIAKGIMRFYGYENPFKALEGRDKNVILIDNLLVNSKLQYCNEHGDGNEYILNKIGEVGGLNLYNIL